MTLFSSCPPFNDGPEPYVDGHVNTAGYGRRFSIPLPTPDHCQACGTRYDPRPEFDRPQHNPTNPILAAFRRYISERPDAWLDVPAALIMDGVDALRIHAGDLIWSQGEDEGLDELVRFLIDAYDSTEWGAHREQCDHALLVLQRLANYTKGN